MKLFKRILLVAFILLVAIQFVPVKLPEVKQGNTDDIIVNRVVDSQLAIVLKTSCYDCHSNQTHYPWYSHVAPVSWLLKNDVEEGRRKLNFSEWNSYEKQRQVKKLGDIKEEVESGDMPMSIYTLVHMGTKLSEVQKKLVMDWCGETNNNLAH